MSSSAPSAESQSVSHYLHPDFLEPLPSALDPKQNPLVLLAQTCNNIGKDVSYSNAKKLAAKAASAGTAASASEARLSPPKLVALKSDEDKVPSSTCLEQRHSPTSTRSPKYAVTPEQAKSADGKAVSPGQHLKEGARVVAASPHREEKTGNGYPSPRSSGHGHLSGTSPIASAAAVAVAAAAAAAAAAASSREKATPPTTGDAKSPAASQDLSSGSLASASSNFPFPIHHPALLSAYPGMPWPTFPFPHIPSLPGLACPCGQCASGLGSPGAGTGTGTGTGTGAGAGASTGCTAGGCSPCSCAHCLSGAASGQHSFLPDSFSSACFYSGLLNSYLHSNNGHSKSAAVAAAAAAAAAAAVPPPASSSVATSSTGPPAVSSASSSSTAPSRTVEYCMYCGKHCPSPEQLLAHLQTHMSASPESTISPPVSASLPAPAAAPPGLGLYSSSAAADLLRKLYASSATSPTPAAGLSPRFHPYRSFLPKLSPHRAPYQPFGAPLV